MADGKGDAMRIKALVTVTVLALMSAVLGAGSSVRAEAAQMVDRSPLSGLSFEDKPVLLEDNGAFKDLMAKVAAEAKRSCGPLERYGWEVAEDDQGMVDKLESRVTAFFKTERFYVREAKASIIWNADAYAFTADKGDKHLLVLLSISPSPTRERASDLVVLICEAPFAVKK